MSVQQKAYNEMEKATRRGELTPEPCEVCGAEKVDAHHDDYLKPLEIRWLCRKHHRLHHAKHPTGLKWPTYKTHPCSVQVHIGAVTRARLLELGKREDRSMNWLIRKFIDEGLAKERA